MRLHSAPSRPQAGFTLVELLVAVAVIGIIAAIAVPNMRTAMKKARHGQAYKNMKVLEQGIQAYMLDNDTPPTSMSTTTLEPLVTQRYISREQRAAILAAVENNRLHWYYGFTGWGWFDYDYGIGFRPKKDPGDVYCYLWPEGIWRWDGASWTQVM